MDILIQGIMDMKTIKLTAEVPYKKIQHLPAYLYNDYEQAVVRSTPNEPGYYVKLKGRAEFKAETGSEVVAEAILDGLEISKEANDNF